MAKQIIDARIKQKTGTFEEWNSNPLILLDGEVALVRTATGAIIQQRVGDGYKTFAELPDNIRYDQSAFISVDSSVKVTGNYTVVGAGVYGGVTVGAGKIAVLYWNGTDWVKNFEGDLPKVEISNEAGQSVDLAISQKYVSNDLPSSISDLSQSIDGVVFLSRIKGFGLNNLNVITTFSGYSPIYTNYFNIPNDVTEIRYNGNYGSNCVGIVFLDSSDVIVGTLNKPVVGVATINVTKPATAVKARASSLNNILSITMLNYGSNTAKFKEIDESLSYIATKSSSLFEKNGYVRYSDGENISSNEWLTTKPYPISSFVETSVFGHTSVVASVAFYKSSNAVKANYLGGYSIGADARQVVTKDMLTPPQGTTYFTCSTSSKPANFPSNTYLSINNIEGMQSSIEDNTRRIVELENSSTSSNISARYMHMSFDDVFRCLLNLKNNENTFTSIFQDPFFKELKRLHDTYGMVFSLYTYNTATSPAWDITTFTSTKFANEFKQNANWLKFGFHSQSSSVVYDDVVEASIAKEDYDRFINSHSIFAGDCTSVDRVPRLHNFKGSLECCQAMRDTSCGVLGFLTSDDTRYSYYLAPAQQNYINTHDKIKDTTNFLDFFKTETRLESASITDINAFLNEYKTVTKANLAMDMIMFTHEVNLYPNVGGVLNQDILSKIEGCAIWAKDNGYSFDFPMNRV